MKTPVSHTQKGTPYGVGFHLEDRRSEVDVIGTAVKEIHLSDPVAGVGAYALDRKQRAPHIR